MSVWEIRLTKCFSIILVLFFAEINYLLHANLITFIQRLQISRRIFLFTYKSSCPEGDRSYNVPDRACSQKNWFAIFIVRDRAWFCSFLFCNFFYGMSGFILKQRHVLFETTQKCEFNFFFFTEWYWKLFTFMYHVMLLSSLHILYFVVK